MNDHASQNQNETDPIALRFKVSKHLSAAMPVAEVEKVLTAAGNDVEKLKALLEASPKTHPGAEWTEADEKDLEDTVAAVEAGEPLHPERRLNARGEELAADFRRLEQSMGGCQCHLNPPCSLCMHEGNPDVLADDETAWEEVPAAIAAREIGRCAICGGKVECVEQKWFHLGEVPLDHEAMYGGIWNQLETTRLEGRALEPGDTICEGDVHGSRQNFEPVPREWIGSKFQAAGYEVFRPVHPILTKAEEAAPLRVTEYHDVTTNREAHELAAGMGLAPEFFKAMGINPDGLVFRESPTLLRGRFEKDGNFVPIPDAPGKTERELQAEKEIGGYDTPKTCTVYSDGKLCDKPAIATRAESYGRSAFCTQHLPQGRVAFLHPLKKERPDYEKDRQANEDFLAALQAASPELRKEAIARFCGPAIPSNRMGLDDAGAFALERQSPSAQAVEEAAGETAGNRPVIPMDLRDKALPERLSSAMFHRIHEDLGTASMCWDPIPAGVFDSTNAGNIAFNLCHAVADEIERCKNGAWRMGLLCGLFLGFLISAATVFFWK